MKEELKGIYSLRPNEFQSLVNSFKRPKIEDNNEKNSILSFLKDCKGKDLLPLLYFCLLFFLFNAPFPF